MHWRGAKEEREEEEREEGRYEEEVVARLTSPGLVFQKGIREALQPLFHQQTLLVSHSEGVHLLGELRQLTLLLLQELLCGELDRKSVV